MKALYISILFLSFSCSLLSQIDLGMPVAAGKGGAATAMVKDWEAIGINPANLGWNSNYKFSIGLLNWGINIQSKALDFKTMTQAYINPEDTFSTSEKQQYAKLFTTEDGLNFQSHINWLAASFATPRLGGFAINLRDRVSAHVSLNAAASDILFNGIRSYVYTDTSVYKKKMSEVFDGTELDYFHYRELNVSYGRKLIELGSDCTLVLYGGIGFKYLWGIADVQINVEKGIVSGNSSISNSYKINYGTIQNFTPADAGGLFNAPGKGTAFDAGIGITVKNKLRLAASVTDIGKISWSNNVLYAVDTLMPKLDSSSTGFNSWDIASQAGHIFGIKGMMNFAPGADYSTNMPTRLRLGAGLPLGKLIQIGADVVLPLNEANGNLENPYMALGGEIILSGGVKVSTGIAGNENYGYAVPLGFTLGSLLRVTEFYIATNDIITFFSKSKSPQASLAVGLLRFNIK